MAGVGSRILFEFKRYLQQSYSHLSALDSGFLMGTLHAWYLDYFFLCCIFGSRLSSLQCSDLHLFANLELSKDLCSNLLILAIQSFYKLFEHFYSGHWLGFCCASWTREVLIWISGSSSLVSGRNPLWQISSTSYPGLFFPYFWSGEPTHSSNKVYGIA